MLSGRRCGLPRLPPGTPSWCHGFCQRENKQINILTPHRTTSAKTRATATLRQRHIPPNVIANAININKTYFSKKIYRYTATANLAHLLLRNTKSNPRVKAKEPNFAPN
jgi:hypothetical protein